MAFWGLGQIAGGVPGGKAQNFFLAFCVFKATINSLQWHPKNYIHGQRNYVTHNQPAFPG